MSLLPYTQLFIGPTRVILISGPHIQVVDTATGAVCASTRDLDGAARDAVVKAGAVRCAAVDVSGRWVVVAGEDKMLRVWTVDGLKLLSERELPKKPTGVRFTKDAGTILVSDKFGDIFSYPFEYTPLSEKQKRDALSSHENPSGGQLILGHTSLLTSFVLSADEKYVISADRDEHVRVSWYPQGYNIEMYCLGHEKYVSAIHVPSFATDSLISGGGDPMLKIWDWMSGTVKHEIRVLDVIEPFIQVRPPKRKRGDGEDGEDAPEGRRRKGRKGKGKGKEQEQDTMDDGGAGSAEVETIGDDVKEDASEQTERTGKVLVVHKIETIQCETSKHIIFSAVGATALFATAYPEDDAVMDIDAFDLGKPIVDFVIAEDGFIWVSLDGEWTEPGSGPVEERPTMVRVMKLSSGKIVDASLESALVTALNTTCLLPAGAGELQTIDLYGDLSAMPKNNEGERDPMNRETSEGKVVSKKELGRLKSKRAVQAQVDGKEPESKRRRSVPEMDDI